MVRLLLKHNAAAPYNETTAEEMGAGAGGAAAGNDAANSNDEFYDPFVKPPVASQTGKYTPLHWASYKGHYRVVWLLLKDGMSPLKID